MPIHAFLRYSVLLTLITTAALPLQAQWSRLPGPFGGNVLEFARDGDTLYALTTGGIYKTVEGETQWRLVENTALLVSSKAYQNWYYTWFHADAGRLLLLSDDNRLLRSADGGKSWKAVFDATQDAASAKETLQGCFGAGDTLFVASNRALYRSINDGVFWEKAPDPDYWGPLQVIAKVKDAFVGRRSSAILISSDGGREWKNVFTIVPPFAVVTVLDTTIFGMYSSYARLIRSENLGKDWEKFDTDSINYIFDYDGEQSWLTGKDNELFFAMDYGCALRIYYSPDRGENWFGKSWESLPEHWLRGLDYRNNELVAGTNLGVWGSQNQGDSFMPRHSGINAAWIDELFQTPNGHWWAMARHGAFRSTDQGQTWEAVFPGESPMWCFETRQLHRTTRRMIYPAENNCQIVASEDNGETWAPLPPWPHTSAPQYFCPDVAVTRDAAWFKDYSGPLYRWRDQDAAPEPYDMPFIDTVNTMTAGDGMLYMTNYKKAYVSDDQGLHWLEVPPLQYWNGNPEFGALRHIDRHAILSVSGMQNDSLFMFDYVEKTWRPYFPVDAVRGDTLKPNAIRILRTGATLRWISVSGRGLYYATIQEPERCYPYLPALPAVTPRSIYLSAGEIWVGTEEAGIFRAPLQFRLPEAPAPRFTLYPNPGSGEPLQLQSEQFFDEPLQLRVFDAAGRLTYEQTLPPGQIWTPDMSPLPAGMYFFQIETSQFRTVLKWLRH